MRSRLAITGAIALSVVLLGGGSVNARPGVVHDALQVQKARAESILAAQSHRFYRQGRFNLDDLPPYVPRTQVTGAIRIWTADLWGHAGFRRRLAAAFHKRQPHARLAFVGGSPGLAFAGLLTGQADVAVGRRMTWVDLLSYQRRFNRDPLVIRGMTGWDVDPPFAIMVNKANPIARLTIAQLDGIFGAQRSGGWNGTTWDPSAARGAEGNIRTWGQLGLKGEWATKPIHVYGYNLQYLFAPRFSQDVLEGSGQWNERLRQFTIHASAEGKLVSVDQQMADALGADPYAIAYYSPMRGVNAATRQIPIAPRAGGPAVPLNLDTVRDHSYPLIDSIWFSASRRADGSIDPKTEAFLRFILSRDAQAEVARDTTMLPLTAGEVAEERRKLR
ncbi:MAG: phosphate ABC transporter substrate-binding protein [Alphaproteobacteria bacterium]|nr:phosphate ABC transporter substrate-binding protein [Alphaproteobacteria bacterium]